MLEMDTSRHPIIKDRWYFSEGDTYYNLDIYPNWEHYAVLEVRGAKDAIAFNIPSGIKEIRNVTEDIRLANYSLSKYFPNEEELMKM